MKRLPFYVVLFNSLFFGIASAGARLPARALSLPSQSGQIAAQLLEPQKLADGQPLLVAVKNPKKSQSTNFQLAKESKQSALKPFYEVVKNTSMVKGLFTLYRNKETGKIFLELKPEQLNKNYLSTMTMESGIGERGIYSGMPLQDYLFYFRRVNNNLHFVVRNVNFRVSPGSPQARSLARSFSDSVLYSVPIKSIHPQRKTLLIDLGDLLLKDVPGLTSALSSQLNATYQLDDNKSSFGDAKGFPLNMEIESVYEFSFSGAKSNTPNLITLPDSRALTVRVRYSLSQLPTNSSYRPRLADDRVGYFITAFQDFAIEDRKEPFTRYINRWNLEKQDPSAPLSPPKKPIVFWIENAVPLEYRDAVKEGVMMWNLAFEKAGFKNAIEVRQMPDNAKWDPADVRYNTIRWINTVDGFFALGPSRVNPITGEILDADILVDASFVRSLKQQYRLLVQENRSQPTSVLSQLVQQRNLCGNGMGRQEARGTRQEGGFSTSSTDGATNEESNPSPLAPHPSPLSKLATQYDLCYGMEAANQFAIGSLALSMFQNTMPSSNQMKEYIHQYLRLIIAHEVGHTLGLRHNFRGSTLLPPDKLNDTKITRSQGLTTSVMDYIPPNLAPQGVKQGDYFPTIIGAYDKWAIQYGYTPSGAAHPLAERRFLDRIADLSANPQLAYATDEDMFDLDPDVNPWDNSSDVLRYSQSQLNNARVMWSRLNKRYPAKGESYSQMSELFDQVFSHYLRHIYYTTKYIGGQSFYRDHAGESNGRLPFATVPVEKQRQALATLQKYVFAADAFNFPPSLLNKLAPSRWMHWGDRAMMGRLDYPIHDSIYALQSLVLKDLLSGDRLSRLRDIELKNQPGQALTLPELFTTLQQDIWTEVVQPDKQPMKISSLRRALQREHLKILTNMVLGNQDVPEDARTLAWYNLRQLQNKLNQAMSHSGKLDEYSKAHLEATRDRISKALNAEIQSK